MRQVFAQSLFGLLLVMSPGFAQTQQATPSAQPNQVTRADMTHKFSTAMGAIAGRQTTFGDLYGVTADCVPLNWYEIIITQTPQHGQAHVVSKDEVVSYLDSNPRKTCNGKPITAKALIYTPDKDYAGGDMIAIQRVSSNGVLENVTYHITVLRDPTGDKATATEETTDK